MKRISVLRKQTPGAPLSPLPCEVIMRRLSSLSKDEDSHQTPNLPAPRSKTSSLHPSQKQIMLLTNHPGPDTFIAAAQARQLLLLFSHSVVSDSATPWTAARQASLSITNSQNLLKLMSIDGLNKARGDKASCSNLTVGGLAPASCIPSVSWFCLFQAQAPV